MHNENVLPIPGVELDSSKKPFKIHRYEDFAKYLKKKVQNCDLKKHCKIEEEVQEKKDEL